MTTPQETTALIRGETVASFASYAEAQRAVDYLSDNGFPVENITIVGSDLKQVERVLGRLTKWKAALAGAGSGAWIGALIGLLLSLFADTGTGVVLILLWGVLYGAVFGALWGFIAHLFTFGQRDFSTFGITVATRYEVYCVREQAARAAQMLIQMPSRDAG
ncbi:general stress protein [Kribbella sp. NPDC051137]|uniref:general stress protein n=1 Tax=Kribbella sp. NPDC051137 TaxID=3155045 RepID=UPI003424F832